MIMSKTAVVLMWALYFNGQAEVIEAHNANAEFYADAPEYCSRRTIAMMKWTKFDDRVMFHCAPYTKLLADGQPLKNAGSGDETINDAVARIAGPPTRKYQDDNGVIEKPTKAVLLWRLGYDGEATVIKVYGEYGEETCPWMMGALSDNDAVFLCAPYSEVPKDGYSNLMEKGDILYDGYKGALDRW